MVKHIKKIYETKPSECVVSNGCRVCTSYVHVIIFARNNICMIVVLSLAGNRRQWFVCLAWCVTFVHYYYLRANQCKLFDENEDLVVEQRIIIINSRFLVNITHCNEMNATK